MKTMPRAVAGSTTTEPPAVQSAPRVARDPDGPPAAPREQESVEFDDSASAGARPSGHYRASLVGPTGRALAHAGPFRTFGEARAAGEELLRLVAAAGPGHRCFVEVVRVARLAEVSDGR
jgi:hypothetical protein